MVFSSITFLLFFLPFFIISYIASPTKFKNWVILLFSLFFYAWGAPKFIFILLGSTIIDFYLVRYMHLSKTKATKQLLLTLSITLNVGLLAYFKYANFFVDNLNSILTSIGYTSITWTNVLLPIGISFYTFQTLTYSIDVYRKIHAPLHKVQDYLLYIMSFPQMIAGPIVRFNLIADQIEEREEAYSEKIHGFFRFCIGLAKKILIANVVGAQADLIMNQNPDDLSSGMAWIGILAYTFQIYFDFSGYSDMAIGLGKIMGFSFPENFNNPYTATSITDFWRRWHMTLGQWMRDYLYIPLGGNKVNSVGRLYFNLIFVFLVSGLWHGASWNFVFWGGFHGVFLILDRLFLIKLMSKLGKLPKISLTFFLVMIGWVFFRIEDMDMALSYTQKLFDLSDLSVQNISSEFILIAIFATLFSYITLFKFGQRLEHFIFYKAGYSKLQYGYLTALSLALFIISVSKITTADFNPFIYFRF